MRRHHDEGIPRAPAPAVLLLTAASLIAAGSPGCTGCTSPEAMEPPPAAVEPIPGWPTRALADIEGLAAVLDGHAGFAAIGFDDWAGALAAFEGGAMTDDARVGLARAALARARQWTTLGRAMHAAVSAVTLPCEAPSTAWVGCAAVARLLEPAPLDGPTADAVSRRCRGDGEASADPSARVVACALVGDVERGRAALDVHDRQAAERGPAGYAGVSAVLARGLLRAHQAAALTCRDGATLTEQRLCARAHLRLGRADSARGEAADVPSSWAGLVFAAGRFGSQPASGSTAGGHVPGPTLRACLDGPSPCPMAGTPSAVIDALVDRREAHQRWLTALDDDDLRGLLSDFRAGDAELCSAALDAVEAWWRSGDLADAYEALALLPSDACTVTDDRGTRATIDYTVTTIGLAVARGDMQTAYARAFERARAADAPPPWAAAADVFQLSGLTDAPLASRPQSE